MIQSLTSFFPLTDWEFHLKTTIGFLQASFIMELGSYEKLKDKNSGSTEKEVAEDVQPQDMRENRTKQPVPFEDIPEVHKFDFKYAVNDNEHVSTAPIDASGDVNMEASITADEVMRAGGFGARDDISSFLPVASDSTDFEASLRDARDYEDLQEEIGRPGLGWKG
ncbi:Uncharacterized protein Adt_33653 [Abeliophyllum distichum]|uniref:Uncharacterized protein n=1 Tax=Abeliophyllum distichum TaxID=126358 RepID=A0ABD1QWV1_9LAMI